MFEDNDMAPPLALQHYGEVLSQTDPLCDDIQDFDSDSEDEEPGSIGEQQYATGCGTQHTHNNTNTAILLHSCQNDSKGRTFTTTATDARQGAGTGTMAWHAAIPAGAATAPEVAAFSSDMAGAPASGGGAAPHFATGTGTLAAHGAIPAGAATAPALADFFGGMAGAPASGGGAAPHSATGTGTLAAHGAIPAVVTDAREVTVHATPPVTLALSPKDTNGNTMLPPTQTAATGMARTNIVCEMGVRRAAASTLMPLQDRTNVKVLLPCTPPQRMC